MRRQLTLETSQWPLKTRGEPQPGQAKPSEAQPKWGWDMRGGNVVWWGGLGEMWWGRAGRPGRHAREYDYGHRNG